MQYKEEVDASEDGPACPLVAPDSYYVDEDCLTINVYTPTTNRCQTTTHTNNTAKHKSAERHDVSPSYYSTSGKQSFTDIY